MSKSLYIGLILLIFAPESPYYLIATSKHSKAKEIIRLLHGGEGNTIDEIVKDIETYIQRGKHSDALNKDDSIQYLSRNDVPDAQNLESNVEIDDLMLHMNTKSEISNCDIKGDGENAPHNSLCHSNPLLLKIILIVAGLFLFTRLCGTLIFFNNTFRSNMGIFISSQETFNNFSVYNVHDFFAGISPISYYMVDILKRGNVVFDPEWSAVGVGIIETIGIQKYLEIQNIQ